jgi:hypothetical protein
MKFNNKIFLPIIKKFVRVEPLANRHYFELSKFITNNDDEGISNYFDYVIKDVLIQNNIFNELSNIDKFLIILNSKIISSGSKISLVGEKNIKTEFSLNGIINNVIKKLENIDFEKTIFSENLEISISLPKSLLVNDIDQIYKEVIKKIVINDECIFFSDLTEIEKDDIMKLLPISATGDILNYITNTQNILKDISIFQENIKIGIQNIPVNAFDNTLFAFIKSLFGENLKNYYELQYILYTKLNISLDHYMSITPNDCKIFINLYNEDMKKQQEEQQKGTSGGMPQLPSMPSVPKFK